MKNEDENTDTPRDAKYVENYSLPEHLPQIKSKDKLLGLRSNVKKKVNFQAIDNQEFETLSKYNEPISESITKIGGSEKEPNDNDGYSLSKLPYLPKNKTQKSETKTALNLAKKVFLKTPSLSLSSDDGNATIAFATQVTQIQNNIKKYKSNDSSINLHYKHNLIIRDLLNI